MNQKDDQVREELDSLRQELSYHAWRYYVLDDPIVPDSVYDGQFARLKELEAAYPHLVTPNSPTQRVGGEPLSEFSKVTHLAPMLSIDDAHEEGDVREFDRRIKRMLGLDDGFDIKYMVEPKMDGVSASLTYENGVLVRAATRGNGSVGEDITANIRTISRVPLMLNPKASRRPPDLFEARCEVFILKEDFIRLKEERMEAGEAVFANARNAAAGSIRQLDPRITASRKLSLFFYGIGYRENVPYESQEQLLAYFREWGLMPNPRAELCHGIDAAIACHHRIESQREDFPYEMDGVVIKVNEISLWDRLGMTMRNPRWMLAYKFAAREAVTRIATIQVQVGRTGVLTPVANLEPVPLAGVIVQRATLHNEEEIRRKDIRQGDMVIIHRAGDVIPAVIRPLTEQRTGNEQIFSMPAVCPVCGADIVKVGSLHRCPNAQCPAKISERLIHAVSLHAFNIEQLGPKIITQFIDAGIIKDLADIFALTYERIVEQPRFADKSAANLIKAIDDAKRIPFHRFIFALGIRNVGVHTASILAEQFPDLEQLTRTTEDILTAVKEIGPETARSVVDFFQNQDNGELIQRMLSHGVVIVYPERGPASTEEPRQLEGKTFVLTGELETFSRSQAEKLIARKGGKVTSSVSSKTSFVIVGQKPGSKYDKAVKLGLTILSEQEFLKLIDDTAE